MPKKGYKPTPEHRKKLSEALSGRSLSEIHRKRLGISKMGKKNPNWKGKEASPDSGRERARRVMGFPKGIDIHHIDGNPTNNSPSNLEPLTRKAHIIMDGRMNRRDEKGHFTG